MPSPTLAPERVVTIQLAALAGNDPATDDGIRRTFWFASPGNKSVTGPAENFARVVRDPAYAPLLDARRWRLVQDETVGDGYRAVVEIVVGDGERLLFGFELGRQGPGAVRGVLDDRGRHAAGPAAAGGSGGGVTVRER